MNMEKNISNIATVASSPTTITEPPCNLNCGPIGNCYIEQLDNQDDQENITYSIDNTSKQKRRYSFKHRCQCPLGKSGTYCQNGIYLFVIQHVATLLYIFFFTIFKMSKLNHHVLLVLAGWLFLH